jgi:phosphate-selective porin OprO/OprP
MRTLMLIAGMVLCGSLWAQNPTKIEDTEEPNTAKGFNFRFKERPSFRYGESLRMDIKAKLHLDFRSFQPGIQLPPPDDDTFGISRARFGLKGEVTKLIDYEIERELRGTIGEDHPRHPWKDVYVDFRPYDFARFKVGKFKLPFGMEQNTSADRLDFVYRSRVTDALTPARERGAMLHGEFLKGKHVAYEAGIFRYDGESTNVHGLPTAGRTYAARLSGEPLRYVRFLPEKVQHIYLGIAATTGEMFEGQYGVQGETVSNMTYFDNVFVKGHRRRTGIEAAWSEGRLGVKGEYLRMSEQRKEQGIRANDLPDKISRGWYVTGSWIAFGEMKSKGSEPKDPFLTGRGFGAIELASRIDVLSFSSASPTGIPSPSPRAANLLPNSDRTWTIGGTWYINHFVKLQANGAREWIADSQRRDFAEQNVAGRHAFWTAIFRLQLAM